MIAEEGFLLSYVKFGESDAVAHFFTRERGYKSYFVRGLYSKQNKKKPFMLPLAHLELSTSEKPRGSMEVVHSLHLLGSTDAHQDVKSGTVLFFVADILNQILRNETSGAALWPLLLEFLTEIARGNYSAHLVLLVQLCEALGVEPLLSDAPFLNPEKGIFQAEPAHAAFGRNTSDHFRILLDHPEPFSIHLRQQERKELLTALMIYYEHHVPEFKTPASLMVLKELFS